MSTDHVFAALAQSEWELFASTFREVNVDPHLLVSRVYDRLREIPSAEAIDESIAARSRPLVSAHDGPTRPRHRKRNRGDDPQRCSGR